MDLPKQAPTGSTESGTGNGHAHPPARSGESPLGLPANPGRAEEARCLGLGNRHLLTTTQPWTPACPTARWSFVEGVLDSAGCRHHGLRLLLCGDCLVEDALCSFLHRTLHTQGPPGWRHCPSQFRLGYTTSPQLDDGRSLGWHPVPDPGPRRQVLGTCLLYTSDAADDLTRVDLGGRRIIKKKK